ncbi:MAG TPA: hypothetical protein VNT30_23925 [Stellaceae bacterium]|nr:hypothetical protein [Stellaceae bacterium]
MAARIPPSEWDAIVLRREQGESVNFIARSYGCSPPAIYSILKRHKGGADGAVDADDPTLDDEAGDEETLDETAPAGMMAESPQISMPLVQPDRAPEAPRPTAQSPAPQQSSNTLRAPLRLGAGDSRPSERPPQPEAEAPRHAAPVTASSQPTPQPAPAQPAAQNQPAPAFFEQSAQRAQVPAALTARLDDELRAQANGAVDIFRNAFDAAMASDAREVRQQLRQAAADLMRVAARTTIVLERLEAVSSRSALPIIPPRRVEPDNAQRDFNQRQRHRPGPR